MRHFIKLLLDKHGRWKITGTCVYKVENWTFELPSTSLLANYNQYGLVVCFDNTWPKQEWCVLNSSLNDGHEAEPATRRPTVRCAPADRLFRWRKPSLKELHRDKCLGMPQALGQWHLRLGPTNSCTAWCHHDFPPDVPGPAAVSSVGSWDLANVTLEGEQVHQCVKQWSKVKALISVKLRLNTSIQIHYRLSFTRSHLWQ